jgi:hypothetical protein
MNLGQAEERRACPGQGAAPVRLSRPSQHAAMHGLHRRARYGDNIKPEDALFAFGAGNSKKIASIGRLQKLSDKNGVDCFFRDHR